jgi:hypothetical protein
MREGWNSHTPGKKALRGREASLRGNRRAGAGSKISAPVHQTGAAPDGSEPHDASLRIRRCRSRLGHAAGRQRHPPPAPSYGLGSATRCSTQKLVRRAIGVRGLAKKTLSRCGFSPARKRTLSAGLLFRTGRLPPRSELETSVRWPAQATFHRKGCLSARRQRAESG